MAVSCRMWKAKGQREKSIQEFLGEVSRLLSNIYFITYTGRPESVGIKCHLMCVCVCVCVYVALMGERKGVYRIRVGKPEEKRPLGRPRRRWEDNIKLDIQ